MTLNDLLPSPRLANGGEIRRPSIVVGCAIVLAAALSVGCTPATSGPPATQPTPSAFGPNDLPPGAHVQVNRQGQWLAATIVQPLGGDRFLIHYEGAADQWNEPVGMDRI